MTLRYEVKLVLETSDGISVGVLEDWFGKFAREHHISLEIVDADGKYHK